MSIPATFQPLPISSIVTRIRRRGTFTAMSALAAS